ncbi:hypothetical protein AMK59_6046, partial [Oryctes borbonicus]
VFYFIMYIRNLGRQFFKNITTRETCVLKCINRHSQHVRSLSLVAHSTHLAEKKENEVGNSNIYTYRTHTCGELRRHNIGQNVVLCGWLQYQRLKKFIVLRDGYGIIQIVVKEEDLKLQNLVSSLPYETIL